MSIIIPGQKRLDPPQNKPKQQKPGTRFVHSVQALIDDIRTSFTETTENTENDPNEISEISEIRDIPPVGNSRDIMESATYEIAETAKRTPVLAIGDLDADFNALVHIMNAAGYIDLLQDTDKRKNEIKLKDKANDSPVILTGDFFDRGDKLLVMLDFIKVLRENGVDFRMTAGNHELMALGTLSCTSVKTADSRFYSLAEDILKIHSKNPKLDPHKVVSFLIKMDIDAHHEGILQQHHNDLLAFGEWYFEGGQNFLNELKNSKDKHIKSENPTIQEQLETARSLLFGDGEYAKIIKSMKLIEQVDDVAYLHAGINDYWAEEIRQNGLDGINEQFQKAISEENLDIYTQDPKIRELFWKRCKALTPDAASVLKELGIKAVFRGHDIQESGMPTVHTEYGIDVINIDIGIKYGNLGGALLTAAGDIIGFTKLDYKNRKVIGRLPRWKHKKATLYPGAQKKTQIA